MSAYVITDKQLNLEIAIVDTDALHQHEETIRELVDFLARTIKNDGCIRHPIIADRKSLLVLDGVHRLAALRMLGIHRIPACLIDYENPAVQVLSWYRTLRGITQTDNVISQIKKTGCNITPIEDSADALIGVSPTVAALQFRLRAFWVISSFEHVQQAYDTIGRIEARLRSIGLTVRYETEQDALKQLKRGLVDAVLCTPRISKEEIVKSALAGCVFGSKATRHVIPARPLSVNVPLAFLRDTSQPLSEVNGELRYLLQRKRLKRLPAGMVFDGRRYEEKLYMFEE